MQDTIKEHIKESMSVKQTLLEQVDVIEKITSEIIQAFKEGNKVLICGNGGSAADSQHMAAELVGRFKKERKALPAIALTTDTSILTAIGNDYGYDKVFSRQVEAHGQEGDIFIGISTSGNSKNIIEAINVAKDKKMLVIGLLGGTGGLIKSMCDIDLTVKTKNTPRIQECHETIIHIICDLVEKELFK